MGTEDPATPPADPAGDATPPPADPPPTPPAADDAPPPELGDPGKQALDRMKADRNAARDEAKALKAEIDKIRTESLPDHEKALKEAVDAAKAETLHSVNSKLFAAEARAKAASKLQDPDLLADPEVALRLLGLGEVPVTESGDIDTEAISEAIDALVASKPYLAGATPPPPPVDLGQGARGAQNQVRQLTRDDLKNMTPQQIVEAKAKGQLTDVLGATT